MTPAGDIASSLYTSSAFARGVLSYGSGYGSFPEKVADEVVFADVVGKEVDAGATATGVGRGGQGVEVREAEHVGFSDGAGGNGDSGDGGVEFGVGG